MAERKPAEPAHPFGYREARRVGWGPNEFTSVGRGGACLPDDKVKELSNFRQLLSGGPRDGKRGWLLPAPSSFEASPGTGLPARNLNPMSPLC